MKNCPTCGKGGWPGHVPPDGDRWRAGPQFVAAGRWEAMWEARGPLVECGPYGEELVK